MLIGSGIIISGKRRLNVTQLINVRNIQATVLSRKVEKTIVRTSIFLKISD